MPQAGPAQKKISVWTQKREIETEQQIPLEASEGITLNE